MYVLPAWVSDLLVWAVWGSALLFDILYTLKAPWWRSWMGWNLFAFDFAVFAIFTPDVLRIVFGISDQGEGFQWFQVADLINVVLLVFHRTYLLMSTQKGWNFGTSGEEANDDVDNGRLDLPGKSAAGLRGVRGLRGWQVAGLRRDSEAVPGREAAADSSVSCRQRDLP